MSQLTLLIGVIASHVFNFIQRQLRDRHDSRRALAARIGELKVNGHLTMQARFFDLEYAAKKKVTRRGRFFGEIEAVTPWSALVTLQFVVENNFTTPFSNGDDVIGISFHLLPRSN